MVERLKKPLAFASLTATFLLVQPYQTQIRVCKALPIVSFFNPDRLLEMIGSGVWYLVLGGAVLRLANNNQNLTDWLASLNPFGVMCAFGLFGIKEISTYIAVTLACVLWLVCAHYVHSGRNPILILASEKLTDFKNFFDLQRLHDQNSA